MGLSIRQVAERLGATAGTVRAWADRGLLQAERTSGNHRRFSEAEVERFLKGDVVRGPARAGRVSDRHAARVVESRRARHREVVPPWEARVREAEADVAVAKAARESRALARAERDEEAARQRAAEAERQEAERRDREAAAEPFVRIVAAFNAKRVEAERQEAEPESPVGAALIDAFEKARLVDRGLSHARDETQDWIEGRCDALSEVREILDAEVTAEWTEHQVVDLVDEVLGQWVEDDELAEG